MKKDRLPFPITNDNEEPLSQRYVVHLYNSVQSYDIALEYTLYINEMTSNILIIAIRDDS